MDEMKKDDVMEERRESFTEPTPENPATYDLTPRRKDSKNLSTAALVLGIVGIVLDFINVWLGLIVGIVGIVISVNARKTEDAQSMATAGLVCSIVAVSLAGVFLSCAICAIGTFIGIGSMF